MLTLKARAKINLALDVLAKRPDGYHEVDMIMQSLELADGIRIEPAAELSVACDHPAVPGDERNLAFRAALLLRESSGITAGARIVIDKKIPVAAGLAGGSSDAAATLLGLNRLWKLEWSEERLAALAVRIGADVPYCLHGGTARATGIGEKLTPLAGPSDCRVLLVTPDVAVPTARIYQSLRLAEIRNHPRVDRLVQRLKRGAVAGIEADWGNVLEEAALPQFPVIAQVKELFGRFGLASLMSGSGPSVFALNPPAEAAAGLLARLPGNWFGCLTRFQAARNEQDASVK
jgi:4-diphosphocytidyl-2-C-methyl-D-erythritol kinase